MHCGDVATNPPTPFFLQPAESPLEPTALRAGDSWQWTRVFAGYPSGQGWTAQYTLNSPTAIFSLPEGSTTADEDGVTFDIALTPTQTAPIAAGTYDLYVTLANSALGAQQTTLLQSVTIYPNIATAKSGVDTRSFAKRTLDMIEAAISGDTSPHVQEYEIQGRRLQYMDRLKLAELRSQYRYEYRQEQIAAGEYTPKRRVGVTFLPNY